ncbi:hypothetical protein [Novosphingobium sp.]|uniref:hypothetical protein n=1 Tax=Novosphingobium sp. TaxID=1874826 RepID=UPI00286C5911|nr:hypothetical protein [Novosphingobium sp.]
MKMSAALCAGVAALAVLPPGAVSGGAQASEASARFVPPAGEMVLARSLIRELSDGQQIVVTRRYTIRFSAVSEGYQIDGELIGVAVDAPPRLASLADLERRRVDPGLFPMQIDRAGILHDKAAGPSDPAVRSEVRLRATGILGSQSSGAETGPLVGKIASGNGNSAWPADLFSARPGERSIERQVTLSDGRAGMVFVVLKVDALLPCGLPQRFERIITTDLAGSRMVSREVFTLSAP